MENESKTMNPDGIIRELGDLSPDAVVTEDGLAKLMGKCRVSIKRAVQRGELPMPIRLFGQPVWTVQALRDHLNRRLQAAQRQAEQLHRRFAEHSI